MSVAAVPLPEVAPATAPGPQVQVQVGVVTGDEQGVPGRQPAQGPVDQEVSPPVETDGAEGHLGQGHGGDAHGRYPLAVSRPAPS